MYIYGIIWIIWRILWNTIYKNEFQPNTQISAYFWQPCWQHTTDNPCISHITYIHTYSLLKLSLFLENTYNRMKCKKHTRYTQNTQTHIQTYSLVSICCVCQESWKIMKKMKNLIICTDKTIIYYLKKTYTQIVIYTPLHRNIVIN